MADNPGVNFVFPHPDAAVFIELVQLAKIQEFFNAAMLQTLLLARHFRRNPAHRRALTLGEELP